MDNNFAAGTARPVRTAASSFNLFSGLGSAPFVDGCRASRAFVQAVRVTSRLAITLALLMLGVGLHVSWSSGHLSLSFAAARADDIEYIYDELGRLVQAGDRSTGQAVQYTYDAVGNITSQTAVSLTNLSVGYFTPNHGPAGTQVTISGTGFNPTASADNVQFNGTTASVVSATQTQLVVTVPSGATTGPIRVQVGSASANSSTPFTVTATADGPAITGLYPLVGTAGQIVTITGTGFDSNPIANRVRFDATSAQVTGSTATTIGTSVPAGSNSGKVRVTTPRGVAISPMDFIVVPNGYGAGSIGSTGRLPTDGSSTSIAMSAANRISVQLFEGNGGDLLTIGVSSATIPNATLKVFNPDGSSLTSGTVTASGQGVQLPALPTTGTYTLVVDAGSNTGSIALSIVKPLLGTLTLNGSATQVTLAPPGERALLTFAGAQGTYANLTVSAVTLSAGTVSLIAPNGAVVESRSFTTAGTSLQPQLPATGTYTVLINPTGSVGGSLSVSVANSSNPTLGVNQGSTGITLNNTAPVSSTFEASAGEYLAITASTSQSPIGSYALSILGPDGTQLTSGTLTTSSNAGSVILNLGPLKVGGTYTVVLQANGSGTGTVNLTVSSPKTGTLTTDGTTFGVSISTPGQGLLYTATAVAGQYLSFALVESLNDLGRINAANITVLRPDGAVLATGALSTTFLTCSTGACFGNSGYYGSVVVDMGPVPESGTYTILVQQTGSGSLDTGALYATLSTPLSGTLTANAGTTNVTISHPGQGLLYNFNANAGDYPTFALSENQDLINAASIIVLNPDGTVYGSTALTITGVNSGAYSGNAVANLGPLTQTGTYSVLVLQTGTGIADTGTFSLTLTNPLTASLNAGNTSNVQVSLPGQAMQITFTGSQGQYESLGIQESGNNGIAGALITVLNPDGSTLTTGTFSPTRCAGLGCTSLYYGNAVVNMGPLPANGTYTVLVRQVSNGTGTLALTLSAPGTSALTANAATNYTASLPGQSLELSFGGAPGQFLAVGLQETSDGIPGAKITVVKPDGTTLTTGTLTTTACLGIGCPGAYSGTALVNIGPLPVAGTYNVLIQQTGAGTGTLTVAMSNPADGGTLSNGTADTIVATLLGQPLQATFAGTAGTSMTLHVAESSGSNITGAAITVFNPDGTPLGTGSFGASCSTNAGCTGSTDVYPAVLPQTGTYTVLMQQKSAGTGALAVTANGVQTTSGSIANYSTSTAGQSTSFTFSATTGQSVSLAITSLVLTPSSPNYAVVYMYNPDGSYYWSWNCFTGGGGCEYAFFSLPQTGSYTVKVGPGSSSQTVSYTATVSPDVSDALVLGTPKNVLLGTVGQSEVLSFTATAGQTLALNLSNVTTVPANTAVSVVIYNSSGSQIVNTSTQTGMTVNLPNLAADTYRVFIAPQVPATSSLQVTLIPGETGVLPSSGTTSNFSTTQPGEYAYLTFTAMAGQNVSLAVTGLTLSPASPNYVTLYMYNPDGSYYWSWNCYTGSGCEYAYFNLPQTGTYTLRVQPASGSQTLSFSTTLSVDPTATLALNTPANVSLGTLGESEVLTFTTTTVQTYALSIAGVTTSPANTQVNVVIYNSGGGQVTSTSTQTGTILNLQNLAPDTYRVFVNPQTPATGSLQLTLVSGVTGTLPPDGTSANFSTATPGQNAYLTFQATAGSNVSLALTNVAVTPTAPNYITLYMYNPDGSYYWSWNCFTGGSGCEYGFFNLPQTGTYFLRIQPASGSQTLSVTTTLSVDPTAVLTVGTPATLNLGMLGESEVLSFTAAAGQTLALQVSGVTTAPANTTVSVIVYNSSGGTVVNTSTQTATTINLPNLAADTYRVFITPQTPATGSLQVSLVPGIIGTVPSDGTSANYSTLAPGQYAYLTFSATAASNVSLAVTNVTLAPTSPNYITIYMYNPDGSYYWSWNCFTGGSGCEYPFYNLPQTGTYSLRIQPASGSQAVSFTTTLSVDAAGTLTLGTPTTVNLPILGESEVLTFTATANQTVALQISGVTTTPANTTMSITLYNSSNGQVTSTSTQTATTINLPNLAAGTYKVFVAPQAPATGSLQITLVPGVTGSVASDGSSANYSTNAPGQYAYLTFSATAASNVSLAVTNVTLAPTSPNYINIYMYNPDGSYYWSWSCYTGGSGCEYAFYNLPQTGTYSLRIQPASGSQAMSFTTTLSVDASDSLALSTPATVNLPTLGESEVLTFTATASQTVALQISGVTTTPANTTMSITLYNSSNGQVTSTSTQTATTINLPSLAAGTYKVFVAPQTPATGSLQITLVPGVTGSVASDGSSANYSTNAPGQYAYLTFSATAGSNVSLAVTNVALAPTSPNYINIYMYNPDGSYYWSWSCYTGGSGCEYAFYNLPQTGTYSVRIQPASGSQTMSFTTTLSADVTGQLTQGTPLPVNLSSLGQSAVLTFTATAGQSVALSVSNVVTTPAKTPMSIIVYNPGGSQIANTSTQTGTTVNLSSLAAGTYRVFIPPQTPATASLQVGYQ